MERVTAARKLMEVEGIDTLLIKSPHNISYLSGWNAKVHSRPIMAVVPLEKETTLIVPQIEEHISLKYAHGMQRVISYNEDQTGLFEASLTTLKKDFIDRSMTKGKLGIEMGGLPISYYMFLKENFPEIELVDAGPIIWKLRMIKTEKEIEYLRNSGKLSAIGMEFCLSFQEEGKTEIEINADVTSALMKRASELYPDNVLQMSGGVLSGYKTYNPHELPTGKRIKKGETLKIGASALFEGYRIGLHRTTVVGKPSDTQRARWDALCEAQRKGMELVKPGTRVCDIHKAIREVIDEAGFGNIRATSPHAHDQARSGSGMGLHYHEPPYLRASDDTKLMPGMVISIQPQINSPKLSMGLGIGDTVLITNTGYEALTNFRKDTI